MQEVTVVEDLQAEVGEFVVAARIQRRAQRLEVVVPQAFVQQLGRDAFFDEFRQVGRVPRIHVGLRGFHAQCFQAQRMQ